MERRDESLIERAKSLSFEENICQVDQETKHGSLNKRELRRNNREDKIHKKEASNDLK